MEASVVDKRILQNFRFSPKECELSINVSDVM